MTTFKQHALSIGLVYNKYGERHTAWMRPTSRAPDVKISYRHVQATSMVLLVCHYADPEEVERVCVPIHLSNFQKFTTDDLNGIHEQIFAAALMYQTLEQEPKAIRSTLMKELQKLRL